MEMPDYNGKSIVNLMSSISKSYSIRSRYHELDSLKARELKKHDNVILFVMDGLGYKSLTGFPDLEMNKYVKGKMTSVFPSTTAACLTTFASGLPPQQSAVTSWFMNIKELGMIVKILPFSSRAEDQALSKEGIEIGGIIPVRSLSPKIEKKDTKCYKIVPRPLVIGDYNRLMGGKSDIIGYRSYAGLLKSLKKIIKTRENKSSKEKKKKKFIYCYSPLFDSACHHYGTKSDEARLEALKLDDLFKKISKTLEGTNSLLLCTADHGLIDSPPEKRINLNEHEEFYDCLTIPMCGEPRAAFLYVRASKEKKFLDYYRKNLKDKFILKTGEKMIKENYFGLFEPDKKLFERIGDYILIARDNYMIKDFLINDNFDFHIANHGGLSKEEMLVPLVARKL
ncbi:MAG: alkaline phosphatase family protein [Candidatus Woesearchaeota archaeon]